MEPQIVFGDWWRIETGNGAVFLPIDLVGDLVKPIDFIPYLESGKAPDPEEISEVTGWGVRLSRPGYLDCTDWEVFESEREAQAYLAEMTDEALR